MRGFRQPPLLPQPLPTLPPPPLPLPPPPPPLLPLLFVVLLAGVSEEAPTQVLVDGEDGRGPGMLPRLWKVLAVMKPVVVGEGEKDAERVGG